MLGLALLLLFQQWQCPSAQCHPPERPLGLLASGTFESLHFCIAAISSCLLEHLFLCPFRQIDSLGSFRLQVCSLGEAKPACCSMSHSLITLAGIGGLQLPLQLHLLQPLGLKMLEESGTFHFSSSWGDRKLLLLPTMPIQLDV
jgi:hypothetical protein